MYSAISQSSFQNGHVRAILLVFLFVFFTCEVFHDRLTPSLCDGRRYLSGSLKNPISVKILVIHLPKFGTAGLMEYDYARK